MEPVKDWLCKLGLHKWSSKEVRYLAREGATRPQVERRQCLKCSHVSTKTKHIYVGPS